MLLPLLKRPWLNDKFSRGEGGKRGRGERQTGVAIEKSFRSERRETAGLLS